MIDYIFVGETVGALRKRPRFPPQMWNVHERLMMLNDKTNNHAEVGSHCFWLCFDYLGVSSSNWIRNRMSSSADLGWIESIKKLQHLHDLQWTPLDNGYPPWPKRLKYRLTEQWMIRSLNRFIQFGNIIRYLRSVAHNSVIGWTRLFSSTCDNSTIFLYPLFSHIPLKDVFQLWSLSKCDKSLNLLPLCLLTSSLDDNN